MFFLFSFDQKILTYIRTYRSSCNRRPLLAVGFPIFIFIFPFLIEEEKENFFTSVMAAVLLARILESSFNGKTCRKSETERRENRSARDLHVRLPLRYMCQAAVHRMNHKSVAICHLDLFFGFNFESFYIYYQPSIPKRKMMSHPQQVEHQYYGIIFFIIIFEE